MRVVDEQHQRALAGSRGQEPEECRLDRERVGPIERILVERVLGTRGPDRGGLVGQDDHRVAPQSGDDRRDQCERPTAIGFHACDGDHAGRSMLFSGPFEQRRSADSRCTGQDPRRTTTRLSRRSEAEDLLTFGRSPHDHRRNVQRPHSDTLTSRGYA